MIKSTERLNIREIDSADDAEFIFELLNSPGFLRYIGDRGVRSVEDARGFIENRFRQSYKDNGFGLYAVETIEARERVGICGFVRRDWLAGPDIGFAFLPEHERKGYGVESATAMMEYGRSQLGFDEVLAITSLDNEASERLLQKLGFSYVHIRQTPDGEDVKLFSFADSGIP